MTMARDSIPMARQPWTDGDCRGRKDISSKETKERESRFAEPIWAMVGSSGGDSGPSITHEQLYDEFMRLLATNDIDKHIKDELGARLTVLYHLITDDGKPDFFMEVPDELANGPREELLKVVNTAMQREAIDALIKHNDKRPLAKLLSSECPLDVETRLWMRMALADEFKHKGGRPKKGEEKNIATEAMAIRRKVAAAAESVPFLKNALRSAYPKPTHSEITKRAKYMACQKYGITEAMIKHYIGLPKSRRLHD